MNAALETYVVIVVLKLSVCVDIEVTVASDPLDNMSAYRRKTNSVVQAYAVTVIVVLSAFVSVTVAWLRALPLATAVTHEIVVVVTVRTGAAAEQKLAAAALSDRHASESKGAIWHTSVVLLASCEVVTVGKLVAGNGPASAATIAGRRSTIIMNYVEIVIKV